MPRTCSLTYAQRRMSDVRGAPRALLLVAALLLGASANPPRPTDADPLTATINTEDVDRFAALMTRTGGKPTRLRVTDQTA